MSEIPYIREKVNSIAHTMPYLQNREIAIRLNCSITTVVRYRSSKRTLGAIACKHCNSIFKPHNYKIRYCSDSCKKLSKNKRRKRRRQLAVRLIGKKKPVSKIDLYNAKIKSYFERKQNEV